MKGTPAEAMVELLLMPNYETFVRIVNESIDRAFAMMSENPELRKARSEDEITVELCNLLRMVSLEATHEQKVGGHCDVTIQAAPNFMWLGEAKRHVKGNDWLYQGFQQLNTRYSTGAPNQNKGGMLIYAYKADLNGQMVSWKDHLASVHAGIQFENCAANALAFFSSHVHERSGLPYQVRHIPLSLYFQPKDKKTSGKISLKKKASAKKAPAKKSSPKKKSFKKPAPKRKISKKAVSSKGKKTTK